MMVAAWLVTMALRRVASRLELLRYVWHPALFVFAVYVIVLASMTLITGTRLAVSHDEEQIEDQPDGVDRDALWLPDTATGDTGGYSVRMIPLLITLTTVAVALALGWAMWAAYMRHPGRATARYVSTS